MNNGDRIWRWIVSVLFGVVVSVIGFTWHDLKGRVEKLEDVQRDRLEKIGALTATINAQCHKIDDLRSEVRELRREVGVRRYSQL